MESRCLRGAANTVGVRATELRARVETLTGSRPLAAPSPTRKPRHGGCCSEYARRERCDVRHQVSAGQPPGCSLGRRSTAGAVRPSSCHRHRKSAPIPTRPSGFSRQDQLPMRTTCSCASIRRRTHSRRHRRSHASGPFGSPPQWPSTGPERRSSWRGAISTASSFASTHRRASVRLRPSYRRSICRSLRSPSTEAERARCFT